MKRYMYILTMLLFFVQSATASDISKDELQQDYKNNKVAQNLLKFTNFMEAEPLIAGSYSEQVKAEMAWIQSYAEEWTSYCDRRKNNARKALREIAYSKGDLFLWDTSINAQATACDQWTKVIIATYGKYQRYSQNPNFSFALMKSTLKGEVAKASADIFRSFLNSNRVLEFLSDDWSIAGDVKNPSYEQFRIGSKVLIENGNQTLNTLKSGGATYQLIVLSKEAAKPARDLLLSLEPTYLPENRALMDKNEMVRVDPAWQNQDEGSTLTWGKTEFKTTFMKADNHMIKGVTTIGTSDPLVLVYMRTNADGCDAERKFLLGKAGEQIYGSNEFGNCRTQFYVLPDDRIYIMLSPEDPEGQIGVLQKI